MVFTLIRIAGPDLPPELSGLAAEAAAERIGVPARVAAEWADGMRFDRPGEALMAGWNGTALAGIGRLTHDPVLVDAVRMRRFYVSPCFRRFGPARRLALTLLASVPGRVVTVNAATADAPAFWEAIGFVRDDQHGHTHVLPSKRRRCGL